jgi:UDP-GlcNAc:undecaprenyl-phosphate GlcNAc-1-phosphate transferase
MLIHYLPVSLVSFFSGIAFLILLKKISLRYSILTFKNIPLIGGVSMGLSCILTFSIACIFYEYLSWHLIRVVIPSLIMLIFGAFDDKKELSVRAKFIVQVISASLLIFFGIRTRIVYIGDFLNIIITFIWIIGMTNAFNLLDIMDGLAAGVAIIASLAFMFVSLLNGDVNTLVLSLILVGATSSFLIYNLPPAKVYMGNSGSHFLGFILATVALMISYATLEKKIALLSPLLVLGLPILDTIFLIFIRISKKKLPFNKSRDHLALRFLALGYSKRKTLLIMLSLGILFSMSGAIVSQANNILSIIIVIFMLLISIILAKKISKVAVDG